MHRLVFLPILVAATLSGQVTAPEFEVATIRPYSQNSMPNSAIGGFRLDGAQFRYSGGTLKDSLAAAWGVKLYQLQVPEWAATDRWEIGATLPAGARRDDVNVMFRNLLNERFQIRMHREKRDFPVYVLVVDKAGLKLHPLASDDDPVTADTPVNVGFGGSAQGVNLNLGHGSSVALGSNRFEARKVSMQQFAATLERFVDRPVVDETGTPGNFDLTIELTPEDYQATLVRSALNAGVVLPPQALRALEGGSIASITSGLARAGLRLEPRKSPLEVIVVDDARKTPTEN